MAVWYWNWLDKGKGWVNWSTESFSMWVKWTWKAVGICLLKGEGMWGQNSLSLFNRMQSVLSGDREWDAWGMQPKKGGLRKVVQALTFEWGRAILSLLYPSTVHWQFSISPEVKDFCHVVFLQAHTPTYNTRTDMLKQSHTSEPSRKWDGAQISSEIHYTANLSQTHSI